MILDLFFVFGEKDGRLAEAYHVLGEVNKEKRDWEKAKEYAWKAYNLALESYGPDSVKTCRYWGSLF